MRFAILVLCIVGFGIAVELQSVTCRRTCGLYCSTELCSTLCQRRCISMPRTYVGEPYLRLEKEFELAGNVHITSGDSTAKLNTNTLYFTTLEGKLFMWETEHKLLQELLTLTNLNTTHMKGLYSVALNRNFRDNHLLYLHYAEPATPEEQSAIYMSNNEWPIRVHHFSTIAQYTLYGTLIEPVAARPILRRHAQFSNKRSGGWMKASVRNPTAPSTTTTLIYALGGDEEHSLLAPMHNHHLSMLHVFIPEEEGQRETMWASGIRNPHSCATSMLKADYLYCLIDVANGMRSIYRLSRNTNYGSPQYREVCKDRLCEGTRVPLPHLSALLNYSQGCPVTSMFMYSGLEMIRFQGHVFLSKDACFYNNAFEPAEILHLAYNTATGLWTTKTVASDFADDMLVDTQLLGGDLNSNWYLAGYSLRRDMTVVQKIIPIRAVE